MKPSGMVPVVARTLCGVGLVLAMAGIASAEPSLSEALRKVRHEPAHHSLRQDEEHLRHVGLKAETARRAAWALHHRPRSACAQAARQVLEDRQDASAALVQSDQDLVRMLERDRDCAR